MKSKYFKHPLQGTPPPLSVEITRKVRFDELDPLGIVWHGNYASFFEEARVALGEKYGIGYMDFANHGILIPLKKFYADFSAPLLFGKTYYIKAILYFNLAARLDFEYEIHDELRRLTTTGYSVQMLLDKQQNIMVAKPDFFEAFCNQWQQGIIK